MKRVIVFLLALALLTAPAFAADKVEPIWTAQATNTSKAVQTAGYGEAQITVWAASGSPDGTVSIYNAPPAPAPLVLLATYATPTTAKTFRGPAGTTIIVALSGNTTGTVGAVAVLK